MSLLISTNTLARAAADIGLESQSVQFSLRRLRETVEFLKTFAARNPGLVIHASRSGTVDTAAVQFSRNVDVHLSHPNPDNDLVQAIAQQLTIGDESAIRNQLLVPSIVGTQLDLSLPTDDIIRSITTNIPDSWFDLVPVSHVAPVMQEVVIPVSLDYSVLTAAADTGNQPIFPDTLVGPLTAEDARNKHVLQILRELVAALRSWQGSEAVRSSVPVAVRNCMLVARAKLESASQAQIATTDEAFAAADCIGFLNGELDLNRDFFATDIVDDSEPAISFDDYPLVIPHADSNRFFYAQAFVLCERHNAEVLLEEEEGSGDDDDGGFEEDLDESEDDYPEEGYDDEFESGDMDEEEPEFGAPPQHTGFAPE